MTLLKISEYIELASIEAEYAIADMAHERRDLRDDIASLRETSAAIEKISAASLDFVRMVHDVLGAYYAAEAKRKVARKALADESPQRTIENAAAA